jgi:hypothetical protein
MADQGDQKAEIDLKPHKVIVTDDDGQERDESPYEPFFKGNVTPLDDWALLGGILFACIVLPPITRWVLDLFGL